MNLANKLTLLRILLVVPFVFFLLIESFLIALIIFVVASLTDFFDGFIARKYNMITDLGKLLDPLADKILVASTLICFIELGWIPAWTVMVIIAREFIVSGFRLAVVSKDNTAVIAADIWGKIKTAGTMIVICAFLLLRLSSPWFYCGHNGFCWCGAFSLLYIDEIVSLCYWLYYACVALTVFSGFTMIYKNRKLFSGE